MEPNHVKLGGISPALYFFCLGGERKMSNYTPKNWTEEDMEQRFVLISPQGLIVVADEGDLRTFITFLDQENLSRYKAQIYEEEQMIAKVLDCEKASGWYDQTLKSDKEREELRKTYKPDITNKIKGISFLKNMI